MNKEKYVIKNTLGMFDLLKGIVMILVVVSHTEALIPFLEEYQPNELLANVNIFVLLLTAIFYISAEASMPALFVISGYGFRKTTNQKCINKQFKTLLIPYLVAMTIATVIHFFSYIAIYSGFHHSLRQTIGIFLGGLLGLPTDRYINDFRLIACGPIWFLPALAIATVVFNFLVNHFDGYKLFLSSLLVMCIGWLLSLAGPLPYSISQAFISVFYLWLGYYIKKNKLFITQIKKSLLIVTTAIIIVYVLVVNVSAEFAMALDSYPIGPVSIIANGLLGAYIIKFFLHLNRLQGPVSSFIRKFGRQSLYFLCVHSIEMVAVGSYLQYLFVHKWWHGDPTIRTLIILGIRIPFAIIVTLAFVRIKDMLNNRKK